MRRLFEQKQQPNENEWQNAFWLFIRSKIHPNVLSFAKTFITLVAYKNKIHFIIRNNFANWLNFMRIYLYNIRFLLFSFLFFPFIDQCLTYQCHHYRIVFWLNIIMNHYLRKCCVFIMTLQTLVIRIQNIWLALYRAATTRRRKFCKQITQS